MDWSGSGGLLVATRAVHFAAATIVAGILLFRVTVARATLRFEEVARIAFRKETRRLLSVALAIAVLSGTTWLVLQAVSMSDLLLSEAISAEMPCRPC